MTDKLADNISRFVQGEIRLPEEEMDYILNCTPCKSPLEITSAEAIKEMRKSGNKEEEKILRCRKCETTFTITERLEDALQQGYTRLGKEKPTNELIDNLMWSSLRKKPVSEDKNELDHWMLDFACIQMRVNLHDWRHRKSCFKNDRKKCRYNIPPLPCPENYVTPVYEKDEKEGEETNLSEKEHKEIIAIEIDVKKRAPFLFFTDCNLSIMSVLNCNNCTKYVKDQKVSLYYGAYTTKHSSDCEKALTEAVLAIEKYCKKLLEEEQRVQNAIPVFVDDTGVEQQDHEAALQLDQHIPIRSDFNIGLGKLLSGVRASTKGETIGAPLAALVLRGIKVFDMSHKTEILPLTQALAFLEGNDIEASINREGVVSATTYDYVYRTQDAPDIECMNFWDFVRTQEKCRVKPSENQNEEEDEEEETVNPIGSQEKKIHKFGFGHPQDHTHGHRSRTVVRWARYLAKRLPDLCTLESSIESVLEELEEKRTEYAKGVLTMFVPWREKSDLINEGETWWDAYLRQKQSLYDNAAIKQTLDNMQNFYESFCRGQPEMQAFDLTEEEIRAEKSDEQNQPETRQDDEIDMAHMVNFEDEIEAEIPHSDDPFIKKLDLIEDNHLKLQVRNWNQIVSVANAQTAIKLLEDNKKKGFCLPGRASLGTSIEDSNPQENNPEINTNFDAPFGIYYY